MSDLKTHTDRNWGEKIFHANENDKKAGGRNIHIRKIDFKTKTITKDKEGYYMMIKGSIKEDITLINICASYRWAPKYIK